jgi:signal transduction histidine kinase
MLIEVSLTEKLAQSNAELQMKKDMMQNLRHEIRNILNVLIGNIQSLQTPCSNPLHLQAAKTTLEMVGIATLILKNYSVFH